MERINVSVRARPLSPEDAKTSPWCISGNSIFIPNQPSKFEFDRIFGEETKTLQVYESRTKDIVAAAVRGFNGTVFAYGQTNSGKTHTMRGSTTEPGGFLHIDEYPPDANQGFDIPSAIVSFPDFRARMHFLAGNSLTKSPMISKLQILILSERLHAVTSQFDQLRAVRFQDAINRAMPRRKLKKAGTTDSTDISKLNKLELREEHINSEVGEPNDVQAEPLRVHILN